MSAWTWTAMAGAILAAGASWAAAGAETQPRKLIRHGVAPDARPPVEVIEALMLQPLKAKPPGQPGLRA